jgi:hypothetical protein
MTEELISAFKLWKSDLISDNQFYEILSKLKGTITNPIINTITNGQIAYIKRLQKEGKIPQSQRFDISKEDAQVLIHNALSFVPIKPIKPLEANLEFKELYEGEFL